MSGSMIQGVRDTTDAFQSGRKPPAMVPAADGGVGVVVEVVCFYFWSGSRVREDEEGE